MRISFKRFVEDELFVRKIAGSLAVRVKKRQNLIGYQAISAVPDFTSLPFFSPGRRAIRRPPPVEVLL
jgi:hypothetical protein